MRTNTQTPSYLLAYNTLMIIKSSDAKVYTRLTQAQMEAAFIDAMTTGEERTITLPDGGKQSIDDVIKGFEDLRRDYLPDIEPSHPYAEYTLDRRTGFETRLFELITCCYQFIRQKNLIPDKTYAEAFAESWSGQAL